MPAFKNNKHSVENGPVTVTAATLKEAYQIVRREHGPEAVILGSRTITQRQETGLGHAKLVEVTIQASALDVPTSPHRSAGTSPTRPRAIVQPTDNAATANVCHDIVKEVNRIEELVAAISQEHHRYADHRLPACDSPLADALIAGGASTKIVSAVLTRYQSETGQIPGDENALRTWLIDQVKASNCVWSEFSGCHAFLGEAGSGRSDLVLAAAAKMQQDGRRVLVLSLMPSNKGDVRRLQLAAAAAGYDAAVINHERQLAGIDKHAGSYDAVLIDLPAVNSEAMTEDGAVHIWLAANTSIHRHLVVPLDKDPRDLDSLAQCARIWSCDWVALSRTDLTTRTAKLLDLIDVFHLPISLQSRDPLGRGSLTIAQSSDLIALVLPAASGFTPGLAESSVTSDQEAVIW